MAFVGTAGWSISARYRHLFPSDGSQLERYASVLNSVEINSSFYRPHQRKTYERWAASVPAKFRFAVKVPRTITHDKRLIGCGALVDKFLSEVTGLGAKLGILLVQLPPSLCYDLESVPSFFQALRNLDFEIACEPRHESWFTAEANAALKSLEVIRVAADPPRALMDGKPGGMTRAAYWRLHGKPRLYYSDYEETVLRSLAGTLSSSDWCMFDNTAAFHALGNALRLTELTRGRG